VRVLSHWPPLIFQGKIFKVLMVGEKVTDAMDYLDWSVQNFSRELSNFHLRLTLKVCELVKGQECRSIDQETQDILEWLSPLKFWSKQRDTFERRQEGTGKWLLHDPEFQKWLDGITEILWCPGDRMFPVASNF
jgi:hypothetical protein